MYDTQPSMGGTLTSSRFIYLSYVTPTPFHLLSVSLTFSIIINTHGEKWNFTYRWKSRILPHCWVVWNGVKMYGKDQVSVVVRTVVTLCRPRKQDVSTSTPYFPPSHPRMPHRTTVRLVNSPYTTRVSHVWCTVWSRTFLFLEKKELVRGRDRELWLPSYFFEKKKLQCNCNDVRSAWR